MKRLAAVLVTVSTAGCGGMLYEVHEGSTKVKGLPFYSLASSCRQETIYLETIYQISVQVPKTENTPTVLLMEKSVPASVFASAAMQDLRMAVTAQTPSLSSIRTKFIDLQPAYDPKVNPELIQVSNTTKPESYVDYAKVHYINVSRPGMGSTSASAKLNANGTLADTSAEVEDKTAETVLGAFPVSETVLGILSKAGLPSIMVEGVDEKTPLAVQLVVTPVRFKHTLTLTERSNPPCSAKPALEHGDPRADWRRETMSDGGAKNVQEENAIDVTGKIVLPKVGGTK